MNIFYLDKNVRTCARMHVDKHCVKMIIEYAQLLSTAHRLLDGEMHYETTESGRNIKRWRLSNSKLDRELYKATHPNHPSAIWARQSYENYMWLASLLIELCKEYTHRYNKVHKVEQTGLCYLLANTLPRNMEWSGFTEPTPAMPDEYKVPNNSIKSYMNYYIGEKRYLWKWKNREVPVAFKFHALRLRSYETALIEKIIR